MIDKNLGGDRLGSGNKNNISLHNYGRSTHNLSKNFKSTFAPGVLYPVYCNIALNGDTFDIDLNAACRTIPTQGPLFDTFKMQIDFFQVPLRLYSGLLHNNPINLGMKMGQVYMPKLDIVHTVKSYEKDDLTDAFYVSQVSPSSLLKYLGLSGLGRGAGAANQNVDIQRSINALPILSYYDIFKNYYANKQEENAYVIGPNITEYPAPHIDSLTAEGQEYDVNISNYRQVEIEEDQTSFSLNGLTLHVRGRGLSLENVLINQKPLSWYVGTDDVHYQIHIKKNTPEEIVFVHYTEADPNGDLEDNSMSVDANKKYFTSTLQLNAFALENIDDMRNAILTDTQLGAAFRVNSQNYLPYSILSMRDASGHNFNVYPLNGLLVKTYQSDLFNNWVQTDWIDGDNGINAITAVDTSSGNFTLDALLLSNKVYNMLNRIAVSGGTYQDWQEAVYGEQAIRHAETPIYCGGMSSEIVFDEIVQNAPGVDQTGKTSVLGTLGGRGRLNGKKGGRLHIKVNEPSIIMGIASITPRICYTQGNKWYLTELDTYNDLHKPELDGIGFEDLLTERLAWWDGVYNGSTRLIRSSVGKVPAWINYMTDVDEAFGDFALPNGKSFMVLSRNYQRDEDTGGVKDVTTYIDPTKYNYAFAYTELDAQNFWVQINMDIKARRKMSARQIPNL